MAASPAFSFYAKDFLTGTATMTLAERGAYVSLLAYQWDAGAVPSAAKERARILGCTAAEERRVWSKLVTKFVFADDSFKNARLEEEREKQAEYRRRQSDKGKASAATRRQPTGNHGSTAVESRLQPEAQPKGNSSSSSSSSSSEIPPKSGGIPAAAPLVMSPMAYERRKQQCAFVGSRLEVPHGLHADLRKMLGGDDPDAALESWYLALNDEIDQSGEAIAPDVFRWLKARYQGWVAVASKNSVGAQIDAWGRDE